MSDQLWEHYTSGSFQSHKEPNYITQQYIKHLEKRVFELEAEIAELRQTSGCE